MADRFSKSQGNLRPSPNLFLSVSAIKPVTGSHEGSASNAWHHTSRVWWPQPSRILLLWWEPFLMSGRWFGNYLFLMPSVCYYFAGKVLSLWVMVFNGHIFLFFTLHWCVSDSCSVPCYLLIETRNWRIIKNDFSSLSSDFAWIPVRLDEVTRLGVWSEMQQSSLVKRGDFAFMQTWTVYECTAFNLCMKWTREKSAECCEDRSHKASHSCRRR